MKVMRGEGKRMKGALGIRIRMAAEYCLKCVLFTFSSAEVSAYSGFVVVFIESGS